MLDKNKKGRQKGGISATKNEVCPRSYDDLTCMVEKLRRRQKGGGEDLLVGNVAVAWGNLKYNAKGIL